MTLHEMISAVTPNTFFLGMIIGVVIGANFGVFIAGLIKMAKGN